MSMNLENMAYSFLKILKGTFWRNPVFVCVCCKTKSSDYKLNIASFYSAIFYILYSYEPPL